MDKLNYKLLNLLLLLIIVYIISSTIGWWGSLILKVSKVLTPFLIAFAIAYSFYPVVRKLERKGIRKNIAITLVVTIVTSFILGLVLITIPLVYDQLIILSRLLGEVLSDASLRFSIDLGAFQASVDGVINNLITSLGKYVSTGTVGFINKTIDFFTKTIIIYIVSIYFLSDMDKIRARIKTFLKKRHPKWFMYVKELDHELGQYLQGLLIFIGIQLIEYCLVFLIVGHPNWLLLGILASITTVIPYFGGLVTNIIAVILASVISTPLFIWTLIICLVLPNIDGYVISPRVYGKTNDISPLWTISSVFIAGSLFGFVGIVIALPLYIVINKTYQFFEGDIKDKVNDIKVSKRNKKTIK